MIQINGYIKKSTPVKLLDKKLPVRRIRVNSSTSSVFIMYDKNYLAGYHNNINLSFNSYYGYPDLSHFIIETSSESAYVIVLVDIIPTSDINEEYFTHNTLPTLPSDQPITDPTISGGE